MDADPPTPEVYLAGLRLTGRRVLVAGAGHVVARRLATLLDAGPDLVVVAPRAHPLVARAAREGRLRWRARAVRDADLDGAWYVMAATDDPRANAQVAAAAEARRVFCVRADDGDAGSAVTPATLRRGRVRIGVLSGGDHRTSMRVRDALDGLVGEGGDAVRG